MWLFPFIRNVMSNIELKPVCDRQTPLVSLNNVLRSFNEPSHSTDRLKPGFHYPS